MWIISFLTPQLKTYQYSSSTSSRYSFSARAGHSKPSKTSDIYVYVLKSSDTQAVQVIDTLMIGGADKSPNSSVSEYKKAKEEMKSLGLTSYEEYMDYLSV